MGSEDYFFYALTPHPASASGVRDRSGHASSPAVANDKVFVGSKDGCVYALTVDGARRPEVGIVAEHHRPHWPATRSCVFKRSMERPRPTISDTGAPPGRPTSVARSNPRRSSPRRRCTWRPTPESCMRSGSRSALCFALVVQLASVSLRADTLALVHQQRYCMGTMFDIIVYHASRAEANRAIERALAEIVRLDQVMSHYRADSNLSTLHREGAKGFVVVDPSLCEVVEESLWFPLSGGRFDVTIAPLLRHGRRQRWKATGRPRRRSRRRPSASDSRRSDASADRIRFTTDCVQLDLGGIGKASGRPRDRGARVERHPARACQCRRKLDRVHRRSPWQERVARCRWRQHGPAAPGDVHVHLAAERRDPRSADGIAG